MLIELSNQQSKQYIDSVAAYEGWRQAARESARYSGGMHWKTVAGRQYLYRTTDRRGNAKSLGPRNDETEGMYEAFTIRKEMLKRRLIDLKAGLDTQRLINSALRVGSVPNEVADVCIALDEAGLMDGALTIVGTHAMHAYAFHGGIRFEPEIMATTDVDLLWNHKSKLSIAASAELSESGLLGVLKKADSSYERDKANAFRARAKSGFMVDLLRQTPKPPWAEEPDRFFENDLVAVDMDRMHWMLSAPRIVQPVVAVDGRVFNMTAPDPRAFAAYKKWLSREDSREPVKRGRDLAQARAVVDLIDAKLPHFANWGSMKSFPQEIRDASEALSEGSMTSTARRAYARRP